MIPLFYDNLFDDDELDNWVNKNLQDYDERITSGSTEVGEMKRENICSLLWNKKVSRTNLANF